MDQDNKVETDNLTSSDSWNTVQSNKKKNSSSATTTVLINHHRNQNDVVNNCDGDEYAMSIRRDITKSTRKIMIIMRGLPGCGKSTLALKIKLNGVVLSADHYFINNKGVYVFDKRKLEEAHAYTKSKAKQALEEGVSPIVIDNTNLKLWEFKPYIKMACEHDYDVKLLEPNTKWKSKVADLAKKNQHNVSYEKIKSMSFDFEHNIDLEKLMNEFKPPRESPRRSPRRSPPRLKPSGLLFGAHENVESFLQSTGSEWYTSLDGSSSVIAASSSCITPTAAPVAVKMENKSVQTTTEYSFTDSFLCTKPRDIQLSGGAGGARRSTSVLKVIKYDRGCDTLELNESLLDYDIENNLSTLQDLFGDRYDKSIYVDLLGKFENDINFVANVISEAVDLNDVIRLSQQQQQQQQILKSPSKLSELCTQLLNSMNTVLARHFSSNTAAEQVDDVSSESTDESIEDEQQHRKQEEKPFNFKIDKSFARSLFNQFADPGEEFDESGPFDVDADLTLAFAIFRNWKATRLKPYACSKKKRVVVDEEDEEESIERINERIEQIETDAQLALELFEHENMCHPIDGYPISLGDCGINATTVSLRQIMAEQKAENNLNSKKLQQHKTGNTVKNPTLAIRLKRRQIHELYTNKLDSKHLDEIFYRNNYNVNETTKFIETQFGLKPNAIDESKSFQSKKKLPQTKSPPGISSPRAAAAATSREDAIEYRELAHEYFQIRQQYFEKATEAHSRGWGAVAQFYAEMGQKQGIYMKKSNETAAVNIFALNNADLNNSNTLDLHGLHVTEAVRMFKQIYKKKLEEYRTSRNKKQKYLYILTGWGRHSTNRNARLRPQIMKYLNQNQIKFQEPNIGLFRVELN